MNRIGTNYARLDLIFPIETEPIRYGMVMAGLHLLRARKQLVQQGQELTPQNLSSELERFGYSNPFTHQPYRFTHDGLLRLLDEDDHRWTKIRLISRGDFHPRFSPPDPGLFLHDNREKARIFKESIAKRFPDRFPLQKETLPWNPDIPEAKSGHPFRYKIFTDLQDRSVSISKGPEQARIEDGYLIIDPLPDISDLLSITLESYEGVEVFEHTLTIRF